MEFPFNHSHNSHTTHTHHHRREDEEALNYPPPGTPNFSNPHQPPPPQQPHPPPFYGGVAQPPPPQSPHDPVPQVFHTSHVAPEHVSHDFNNYSAPPYPPQPHHHHHEADHSFNYGHPSAPFDPSYTPPGSNTNVRHVAHETHHPNTTNFSSSVTVHHVSHQGGSSLSNKPTVRVVTKAAPNYSLTIRHGKVILAPYDPSDQYQHWYKDEKYSTRVKDEEGCPSFSLVNKVTGEAIKHSIGATHPVRLIPYNPDYLDESILWTESRDLGGGHRAIRMVNNVRLNVDAYHGDKKSGGVHDGTTIVLWEWNNGDNQQWKIIPHC